MRAPASESPASAPDTTGSPPWLSANLERLRRERGVSLAELAERSGLDEPLLTSIEAGSSAPSIKALWGIATALGVPFSTLLQAPPSRAARTNPSAELRRSSLVRRALLPFGSHAHQRTEVHELKLRARGAASAARYASGTFESLLVTKGRVIVKTGVEEHLLETGDSLVVRADAERHYTNPDEVCAVIYAVVSPAKLA